MIPSQTGKNRKIIILGAGGTGLLMAESILRANAADSISFLDDDLDKQAKGYCGFPVLGGLGSWEKFPTAKFVSGLYSSKENAQFFELIRSLGIPESSFATVVDPSAVVMPKVTIGAGSYIGPLTVVEPNSVIGRFCALLGSVYISHDTRLDDYVACANSVSIAGGVSIGSAAYIGANACIREYTRIGARAIIGMGSVVIKDVLAGEMVAGNPAKPLGAKQ